MHKRLSLIACAFVTVTALPVTAFSGDNINFRYSKGVSKTNIVVNGKKVDQAQFENQMRKKIAQISRSRAGKDSGLNFTSLNIVKDCSASVTCGNGTTLKCSIQGPGTCESGLVSVACIQGNTSETQTCPQ